MNIYQKYFLIVIYLYLNLYAMWQIFKIDYIPSIKKLLYIFILWGVPFVGYLYMMIKVIYQPEIDIIQFKNSKIFEKKVDLKTTTWTGIMLIVLLYGFLYIILGQIEC
ncbi:MAG: hypothetical protein RBR33_07490 [Sulfurovaceae bacterium]|nr:hypothetical protein [Sulfurovaceae bacterium]